MFESTEFFSVPSVICVIANSRGRIRVRSPVGVRNTGFRVLGPLSIWSNAVIVD